MRSSPKIYHTAKPEPLKNLTSTKATIYEYTTIGLVVLIHFLDDHPRHVRYRETLRKNAGISEKRRERVDTGGGERKTRTFTLSAQRRDSGFDGGVRARTPPTTHRVQTTSTSRTEERRSRTPPPPPPARRTNLIRPSPHTSPPCHIKHVRPSTPPALLVPPAPPSSLPLPQVQREKYRHPSPPLPHAFKSRRERTPEQVQRSATRAEEREAWGRIRGVTPSTRFVSSFHFVVYVCCVLQEMGVDDW
jgi:hypothetical protein